MRDNIESFPLDPSGKRSLSALSKTGIDDKTIQYDEFKNKLNPQQGKKLVLK